MSEEGVGQMRYVGIGQSYLQCTAVLHGAVLVDPRSVTAPVVVSCCALVSCNPRPSTATSLKLSGGRGPSTIVCVRVCVCVSNLASRVVSSSDVRVL